VPVDQGHHSRGERPQLRAEWFGKDFSFLPFLHVHSEDVNHCIGQCICLPPLHLLPLQLLNRCCVIGSSSQQLTTMTKNLKQKSEGQTRRFRCDRGSELAPGWHFVARHFVDEFWRLHNHRQQCHHQMTITTSMCWQWETPFTKNFGNNFGDTYDKQNLRWTKQT